MITTGDFSYGHNLIQVMTWGEGSELFIGKFCSIAENVRVFLGGNHNSDWISTYPFGWVNQESFGDSKHPGHPSSNGDVRIGNDVWIGYGATIMSGVSIGSGAIIAANSHVVTDVPEYEIWGGNPARLIKCRFTSEVVSKLLELNWWDYPVEKVKSIQGILSANLTAQSLIELEKVLNQ